MDKVSKNKSPINGRIGRKDYALSGLVIVVPIAVLFLLPVLFDPEGSIGGGLFAVLLFPYIIFAGIAGLGLRVRRLHDLGYNGWGVLILFLPMIFRSYGLISLIVVIFEIYLLVIRGEAVENKYGHPKTYSSIFSAIFNRE